MDFIERFLGMAPDGGTGVLEMCLFLIPVGLLALAISGRSYIVRRQKHH